MMLESGATINHKPVREIIVKDREMGVKPRENNGTLRQMTKQGSRGNFGWKQPIFEDMKKEGIDLENMAESSAKTQTSYLVKLLL